MNLSLESFGARLEPLLSRARAAGKTNYELLKGGIEILEAIEDPTMTIVERPDGKIMIIRQAKPANG
jgi:hypothetical protein